VDTTETGTFLELTEGLQIGGGKQVIWAPPYFDGDIDSELGIALDIANSPQTEVFTGQSLPQDVMDRASSLLIVPPQDGGSEIISVEGFLGPGKILPIFIFQLAEVDSFQLDVFFNLEVFTFGRYVNLGVGPQFTELLQSASVIGVNNPDGSVFRRWHMVLGTMGYSGGTGVPSLTLGF
jgi:hypothetical protein